MSVFTCRAGLAAVGLGRLRGSRGRQGNARGAACCHDGLVSDGLGIWRPTEIRDPAKEPKRLAKKTQLITWNYVSAAQRDNPWRNLPKKKKGGQILGPRCARLRARRRSPFSLMNPVASPWLYQLFTPSIDATLMS